MDVKNRYRELIIQRLGENAEVFIQELQIRKPGSKDSYNIYGYLRSPLGYGNECNLIAMPINY